MHTNLLHHWYRVSGVDASVKDSGECGLEGREVLRVVRALRVQYQIQEEQGTMERPERGMGHEWMHIQSLRNELRSI